MKSTTYRIDWYTRDLGTYARGSRWQLKTLPKPSCINSNPHTHRRQHTKNTQSRVHRHTHKTHIQTRIQTHTNVLANSSAPNKLQATTPKSSYQTCSLSSTYNLRLHICLYIYMYTYIYLYKCIHVYICIYACYMFIYSYRERERERNTCLYWYVYIYIYIYIYIYSILIYTYRDMGLAREATGPSSASGLLWRMCMYKNIMYVYIYTYEYVYIYTHLCVYILTVIWA